LGSSDIPDKNQIYPIGTRNIQPLAVETINRPSK
jgi:hypothetical protein